MLSASVVKRKKLIKAVVNGENVFKWAYDYKHFEALVRIDYLSRFGVCKITDKKVIEVQNGISKR